VSVAPVVLAVDAGTTGVRSMAVEASGAPAAVSYRELTQHYPRPGWVEHDAAEIWGAVRSTAASVLEQLDSGVAAIGITNQRETLVAWDRRDGSPLHPAIVWQDRRTAGRTVQLREQGHLDTVRSLTGLVLDPYFSATKAEWILGEGGVEAFPEMALGTVDSWILWNLTGGTAGGVHATDVTNASRTLLFDIDRREWSPELCDLFGVPESALASVLPSCGRFGVTSGESGLPARIPVSGIAGDQHAALFGQACLEAGMAKATHGTGSFVLMNVGERRPPPAEGILTTVAWDLGRHGAPGAPAVAYALEGSIFCTGATLQWLRDELGLVADAAGVGPLAAGLESSEGVFVVPAFAGLGSPWWDSSARGAVVGIGRGTGRAHVARAAVEAIAYQTRDVMEAMAASAGCSPTLLRVDGGASVMDLLLQIQADQLRLRVARPIVRETTAMGAAYLAGLAEGVWGSVEEVGSLWAEDRSFEPSIEPAAADAAYSSWRRAVERARGWAGG
jgi:glycerol kinase